MINDEIQQDMSVGTCDKIDRKIFIFHVYIFNMDISLIIALIFMRTCILVAEICLEGSMSRNFYIGHSIFFFFM